MTKASITKNLIAQKLMLAGKYDRRAAASNSRPNSARMQRAADKYRRVAKQLTEAANSQAG